MIKIIELIRTCTWCPAQWEGKTECDRLVYIKERHSNLTIRLSQAGATDIMKAIDGELIYGEYTGTEGRLRFDELMGFTIKVLEFSEEVIEAQMTEEAIIAESFIKWSN